jgi:hypothetical protein
MGSEGSACNTIRLMGTRGRLSVCASLPSIRQRASRVMGLVRNQDTEPLIRRSSGDRWSIWCDLDARPKSWRVSSSRPAS